jgi:hypothetical protein
LIPAELAQGESALFSFDLDAGGPMAEGKLGTAREKGIELPDPLVDFAAQANIAAFASGKSASTGDD